MPHIRAVNKRIAISQRRRQSAKQQKRQNKFDHQAQPPAFGVFWPVEQNNNTQSQTIQRKFIQLRQNWDVNPNLLW